MESALRREVYEETGIHVRLSGLAGSAQSETPERMIAFLLFEAQPLDDDVQVRLSDEHDEFQWVPRSEMSGLEFPSQFREFIRSYAQAAQPARKKLDPTTDWYRDQVQQFRDRRNDYQQLAETLIRVLEDETQKLGIHAIVQSPAKTIASFAEKIQRPGKSYRDPIDELTDLCGARVIAHTLSEVADICRFVEDRFQVNTEDSGDKSDLLGASEFGYLSRHYIVSLKAGAFPDEVVPRELVKLGLKAEIQVRTILQHAWADTAHELSYKNSFKLPRRLEREFARLAAVLEEADRGFQEISTGLREYATSYGAYLDRPRLEQEVQRQKLVLEADPHNEGVAHQLAKLAMSLEDWPRCVAVLQPFADSQTPAVLRDLGISLCKLRHEDVDHSEFVQGQAYLVRATELARHDVDAWASLAGTWRTRESTAGDSIQKSACRRKAKEFYQRAYRIDPGNPYSLGNYIEYEMVDHPQLDIASFFGPSLEAASRRCIAQAQVGVNLPWAYFDLGKFNLLLHRPHEALGYYSKGANCSPSAFFLNSALSSFVTLQAAADSLPGFDWSRDFLRLVNAYRFGERDDRTLAPTPQLLPIQPPVIIVAGYCGHPASDVHRALVMEGLRGFQGTIISGGTDAGISALVGELQTAYAQAIHTIGYIPRKMPDDVKLDARYAEHRVTSGDDFSLREPLQYWSDLMAADIPVQQIRMLVIGGGRIAACECQMALALGVATAVIDEPGSAVGRCLTDFDWLRHPCLHTDIDDAVALRTFVENQDVAD